MELLVEPLGRVLKALPGANLLEVLRENSVPVSFSCRSGRCGTCRCRVVRGQILGRSSRFARSPRRRTASAALLHSPRRAHLLLRLNVRSGRRSGQCESLECLRAPVIIRGSVLRRPHLDEGFAPHRPACGHRLPIPPGPAMPAGVPTVLRNGAS
ncbi:MAG: 2Fe-2S iron-sulfur cluster-binding protein [Microvirga sp.]